MSNKLVVLLMCFVGLIGIVMAADNPSPTRLPKSYDFGIGKRSVDNPSPTRLPKTYDFGIGKRSADNSKQVLPPAPLGPGHLKKDEGKMVKRDTENKMNPSTTPEPLPNYRFGIGKRSADNSKQVLPPAPLGPGHLKKDEGKMVKRDTENKMNPSTTPEPLPNYRFGIGKRSADNSKVLPPAPLGPGHLKKEEGKMVKRHCTNE